MIEFIANPPFDAFGFGNTGRGNIVRVGRRIFAFVLVGDPLAVPQSGLIRIYRRNADGTWINVTPVDGVSVTAVKASPLSTTEIAVAITTPTDLRYRIFDVNTSTYTTTETATTFAETPSEAACAISVDAAGLPHISYIDAVLVRGSLLNRPRYARRDSGGSWSLQAPDSPSILTNLGCKAIDIVVPQDDLPRVGYITGDNRQVCSLGNSNNPTSWNVFQLSTSFGTTRPHIVVVCDNDNNTYAAYTIASGASVYRKQSNPGSWGADWEAAVTIDGAIAARVDLAWVRSHLYAMHRNNSDGKIKIYKKPPGKNLSQITINDPPDIVASSMRWGFFRDLKEDRFILDMLLRKNTGELQYQKHEIHRGFPLGG